MNQRRILFAVTASFAIVTALLFLRSESRQPEQKYNSPAMIKWLDYFKVDARAKTHPFAVVRVLQDDSKDLSMESPFYYDFLVRDNRWNMGGSAGKIYLIAN